MEISADPPPRCFRVDDLEVDLDRQVVRRDGQELELPDLSFKLLASLTQRAPNRVTKDELIRDVWGDVVVSDETLAQRVRLLRQALGEDSQNPRYIAAVRGRGYRLICQVRNPDDEPFVDRNRRIWLLTAATALVALVGAWYALTINNELPITADVIAVLPFVDLSADQSNRHFADGMQEELLTRLTRIEHIGVVSRTSVEQYRSTEMGLPEIARRVGADAIIEGSVRIAADRVRITVQLIDATTDRHIWAKNFDRELTVANLFSIQEDVAGEIAQALQLEYEHNDAIEAIRLPTHSLEAYDAYLLGRYHTFRQTPQSLESAVTWLEKATALDPEFAEAYTALGWAYSFLGTTYGRRHPSEVYPKAKEAALRALALDSDLANARSLYADILTWYDWDFDAAEREFKKTIELDPSNALGYALFLSTQMRHAEAVGMADQWSDANLNDTYLQINAAWRYLNAGQVEKAIVAATRGGDHPDASSALGHSYIAAGEYDQAARVFEADLDLRGSNPSQLSNLATAYFRMGRRSEGQDLLAELEAQSRESYVSPALLASVYFAAGDAEAGFILLETAVADRAREVIFIQVSQMLAGHREDPRYDALMRSVGFN